MTARTAFRRRRRLDWCQAVWLATLVVGAFITASAAMWWASLT